MNSQPIKPSYENQKILILGAARQGLASARYLLGLGSEITINDQRTDDAIHLNLKSIEEKFGGDKLHITLGQGHPLELLDGIDLVCVSGGIPLTIPLVAEAVRRGIPLTNDSQLLMDAVPCKVIGITGSAGKTTTTTLVGRMISAWVSMQGCPFRHAWVGGNIGNPLIEQVGEFHADDLVILEMSSFQLDLMTTSPNISAVLNLTPNHLDRHGNMEAYAAAKANILTHQNSSDWAILNHEEPGSWGLSSLVRGKLATFGIQKPVEDRHGDASFYLNNNQIVCSNPSKTQDVFPRKNILLRGEHNQANVLAACTIAYAAGAPVQAMQAGVEGFGGVPHRLEFVRRLNGADWFNDSIATAPERTLADIRSFDEPLILLLGGRDKNLSWDLLTETVLNRANHTGMQVILFGETTGKIITSFQNSAEKIRQPTRNMIIESGSTNLIIGNTVISRVNHLEEAVKFAATLSQPGDVILLSPGGTSFDEFRDFEERGECFRKWVNQI